MRAIDLMSFVDTLQAKGVRKLMMPNGLALELDPLMPTTGEPAGPALSDDEKKLRAEQDAAMGDDPPPLDLPDEPEGNEELR